MSFDIYSILAGIVGTIITTYSGWFIFLRKNRTDEASIALAAWKEMVNPMREEIERLNRELTKLERKFKEQEIKHQKEREALLARINYLEIEVQNNKV